MAKTILIVDDDLESVKLIGLMLERRGYQVVAAHTGGQALEKALASHPDLIILDVMMPDMDGYEVSRRLRADPTTADMPIIMFTAKSMVDDKIAGFQAGADDYLTKPIHPDELLSRVEAVLLRQVRRPAQQAAAVPQAKVFACLGAKGGVGTTSLAVNLAVMLTQIAEGKKVLLMDVRPGLAATSFQLGLRRMVGLQNLLDKPIESLEPNLIESQLEEHRSGLLVLGGQIEPPGIAAPIPPAYAEIIANYLGSRCDYLVLDLGVGLGETNQRLLQMCSKILVAIEPRRATLLLAQALLGEMSGTLTIPHHRIGLVLVNKIPSATGLNKQMIEGLLQCDLNAVIPPAPEMAFQSEEQGVPMVTMRPESLIAQQYRTIAEYVLKA